MRHEIRPLIGAGKLVFGMSPDAVRATLGVEFKSFLRTPTSTFPCDHFPSLGVFAYYKSTGLLEALEFASPAETTLDEIQLVGMNFEAAKKFLSEQGIALPTLFDTTGSLKQAFAVSQLPHHFLISPSLKIVWQATGAFKWNEIAARDQLMKVMEDATEQDQGMESEGTTARPGQDSEPESVE